MADKWAALFGDSTPAAPAAKTGVGPDARRARAGMPPGPSTDDPEPSDPQYTTIRTVSGESTPGRLPPPPYTPEGVATPVPDPSRYRFGVSRAATELEGDPMAQGMVAGAMAAPLGAGAVGLAGKLGGPAARAGALPLAATGEGAASAKMQGANAGEGALFGGAFALGPALANIGAAMSARQAALDSGVVQHLSQYAPAEVLQDFRRSGYSKMAETARKYGVVGAPSAERAFQGTQAGLRAVGGEIGNVYSTIGSEFAPNTGDIMARANRTQQSMRGTVAGNEVADALHEQMSKFFDAHGGNAATKVPLGTLREEITNAQRVGYSGAKYEKLPESGQKEVAREWADILGAELQSRLALAKQDPRFASSVDRLKELNPTYGALKALEETTARAMDREMKSRAPTLRERFSFKPLPPDARPVTMPTGRRLGTLGLPPVTGTSIEGATAASAGLTGALANKDRDPTALTTEMRNIFLGAVSAP